MRNLLNPKWLLIFNTIPITILLIFFYDEFRIIKTLLSKDNIQFWFYFNAILAISGFINLIYSLFLIVKKQNISFFYALFTISIYILFIYFYIYSAEQIIPSNLPRWMIIPSDLFIYLVTFLMPTLVYCLFVLAIEFTPKNEDVEVNFAFVIIIPFLAFLFSQVIIPLHNFFQREFILHIIAIFFIAATTLFLFFLIRSILILINKKTSFWHRTRLFWEFLVCVIFPILGLWLNSGGYFLEPRNNNDFNIFGNFRNSWFYILAVINGLLICLNNFDNKFYRLFLFIGRSITFTYTFYFFLVFLPFLPLSINAIILIGLGFLMLTPLILFIIHTHKILNDFNYLKKWIPPSYIMLVFLASFLVIPTFITLNYLKDRKILNETLLYLYSHNYSQKYNIDTTSLKKTLESIKISKTRNRNLDFDSYTPYISSYFNYLVLDNLTLSDAKINYIESVFLGSPFVRETKDIIRNDSVKITNISTRSNYDSVQKAWKSWIDLEITNQFQSGISEYTTTIEMPEGCWISDYYLYVENKKEFGLLTEKKSAMWIFSNIRNQNKDPGILYYLTGNKVAFRVFPFSKNEIRKTGIEFLHKEPLKLSIDNNVVELGKPSQKPIENLETENAIYISSQQKQKLPSVYRTPYFHFLVDVSKDKKDYKNGFIKRIEKFLEKNHSLKKNAKVSFVNSQIETFSLDNDWKKHYEKQDYFGGFYLERAINMALFEKHKSVYYPIIIVITDKIKNAILNKDFADIQFTFPESNLFFNLDNKGILKPHSLIKNPIQPLSDTIKYSFQQSVWKYKIGEDLVQYLPKNNQGSIVVLRNNNINEKKLKEKEWKSGLIIHAKWIAQTFYSESSNKEWLNLVKYSFRTKIMTPLTSYLVVENEAQKASLKKKQTQVLNGNKSLDLNEDADRMSEPTFWFLGILFIIFIIYTHKDK